MVGLGQVGMGYDLKQDGVTLTHARAFQEHPGFELVGGMDPDPERRKRFSAKYQAAAFSSLKELIAKLKPEVFAISTPTSTHFAVCLEVMEAKPKAIVLEKPVAPSL